MTQPRASVIVLHYKQYARTRECLNSLRASTYPNLDVIVIDNGSDDGAYAEMQQEFPEVRAMQMTRNLGFAGGVNVGLQAAMDAGTELLMLLNNDAVVAPDCIERLAAGLQQHPRIGILSPKFIRPATGRLAAIGFRVTTHDVQPIGWDALDAPADDADTPVAFDAVSGGAMLIRRAVIERIGLFDERFFFYFEDTDFCVRARAAGFEAAYLPAAVVYHSVSESTKSSPGLADFYLGRSRQIYFRKHLRGAQKWSYAITEPLRVLRQMRIKLMKERNAHAALHYLRGALAGWLTTSTKAH
jgi:GT2 family glycosyltransferase